MFKKDKNQTNVNEETLIDLDQIEDLEEISNAQPVLDKKKVEELLAKFSKE